jgi:hypothetical protein
MTPFSLADLGLSDEEIAALEGGNATPATPSGPANRAEQHTTSLDLEPPDEISDEPALKPFSLDSLGLSDEELAGLDSLDMSSLPDRPTGDRTTQPLPTGQPGGADEDIDTSDLPLDLQPFSLDELDLNTGSTPSVGGLGSSLQPFSFDEPPQRPRVSGFVADEGYDAASDEQDSAPETGGFSWQEPTQKPQPGFLKSLREEPEAAEGSIFAKLKQRHTQEERVAPTPPPPPPPIGEDEHLGLFSMDDVPLRDEVSTSDSAPPAAAPPEPTRAAPLEVDDLQEAVDAGLVQPFSLADLGLSEEEIAAFGLGDAAAAAAGEPATPPDEPPAAATERTSSFQLDDLEPVEAEPPEGQAEPTAQADEQPAESDDAFPVAAELQPFSLTDLGLSDEEIAALGLDTSAEGGESVGGEIGIT